MSIVKDVAHQKMIKKTEEKRKAKTRTFIKVGIFWQPKKRPRNRYLAPTHYYYYFEEANSRTGGQKERERHNFLQFCCCLTVEVEVEMGEENTWQVGFVFFLMGPSWMNETE